MVSDDPQPTFKKKGIRQKFLEAFNTEVGYQMWHLIYMYG